MVTSWGARHLGYLHPAELRLPLVKGRRADPVAAAYLHRRHARLLLLQDPDNLLFAEPAALHPSESLRAGLYSFLATFQGSTSLFQHPPLLTKRRQSSRIRPQAQGGLKTALTLIAATAIFD